MAGKQNVRTLLSKQLGKDVADALLNKVDALAKQGASPAKIEKVFLAELNAHLEKRVGSLLGTVVQSLGGVRALVAVHAKK
jgi:hypothetical protein